MALGCPVIRCSRKIDRLTVSSDKNKKVLFTLFFSDVFFSDNSGYYFCIISFLFLRHGIPLTVGIGKVVAVTVLGLTVDASASMPSTGAGI